MRVAETDASLSADELDEAVVRYMDQATSHLENACDAGYDGASRILGDPNDWDILLFYPPFEEALVEATTR